MACCLLLRRFAKHVAVSDRVKDEVESWGLKLVPTSREHAAHTLTAAYLPEGLTPAQVGQEEELRATHTHTHRWRVARVI